MSLPGFSDLWQNLLITTSPVPPGWCMVGFVSHLLKLVDHCKFSHHPFVCSANWFCFEMRSQHMLHLAKLNMLMLCCCVKCLRTVSFRLPFVFGIIPPTFWKQILRFFCFFLICDPTSHDDLDLCSPCPRKGQVPLPWGSIWSVQHAGWWASLPSALHIGLMLLGWIHVCGLWQGIDLMRC